MTSQEWVLSKLATDVCCGPEVADALREIWFREPPTRFGITAVLVTSGLLDEYIAAAVTGEID
jgi:hypothetical protein